MFARIFKKHRDTAIARSFAEKNGMVYFGDTDFNETVPVRGFTLSTGQSDEQYFAGGFEGFEIAIVLREDRLIRTHESTYKWLIAQVKLHQSVPSHALLLSSHMQRNVFEGIFLRLSRMKHVIVTPEIDDKYLVYALPMNAGLVQESLTPLTGALLKEAEAYTIEIDGENLFVYTSGNEISEAVYASLIRTALKIAQAFGTTALQ